MKLRPHHLLCISAFKGKGYSKSFIQHMYKIAESVKDNKGIEITEGIDDICQFCPNRMDDKCSSEEKVTKIDNNVIKLLDIEIKKY